MARSLGVDTARYLHESFDDDTMIVDTVQGGLVAAASRDEALAAEEFAAAASLGLADGRPERHAASLGGGGR